MQTARLPQVARTDSISDREERSLGRDAPRARDSSQNFQLGVHAKGDSTYVYTYMTLRTDMAELT